MSTEEIAEAWNEIANAIGDLRSIVDDKLEQLGYGLDNLSFDERKELDRKYQTGKLPEEVQQLISLHDDLWDAY